MVFDTASVDASLATGGVRINFIAREGGNQYHGTLFGNFANGNMQTTNVDARLLALNPALINGGTVDQNWDFNPGFGGPIRRDRLWFYASGRSQGAYLFAPGMFFNQNANNPDRWDYSPDLSRPASNEKTWLDAQLRLSYQATPRNKIGFTYTQQDFCACHDQISATIAPEAGRDRRFPTQRVLLLDWTSPVTNRVLIEASGIHRVERWGNMHVQTKGDELLPTMIGVQEQGGAIPGLQYRGRTGTYNNSWNANFHWRFNVSYITGAHAFKFGVNDAYGYYDNRTYVLNPVSYRFNNGVPNRITMQALPHLQKNHVDQDFGLFAQDKWTINRLTVSYGLRYDHYANSFPEQDLGPTFFTPTRNITFAETANASYHDLSPKSQVAYDVFGNGKTAVKVSLNRYLQGLGTTGALTSGPNPIAVLATSANRNWIDGNRNYVPDCDLFNPALQDHRASGGDLCSAFDNSNFGRATPTTAYDPDLLRGFGTRFYNWEFSSGVQQQILPRLAVDVSYFRRWYGNFFVVDNRATEVSDYGFYSVTAPSHPGLPGGGGYTVSGFADVNPDKVGQVDNYATLANHFGKMTQRWNGVDVTFNARPGNGIFLQGGTSTGRAATNSCEVWAKVPEAAGGTGSITTAAQDLPYCDLVEAWTTQVKGAASYTIPRIDVSVAATYQYLPGPVVEADWPAPNAVIAPSLGRPLSNNAANATVNLIAPNTIYGDGLNQLDLRLAKILRFGPTRTTINLDIYNTTNANTILTQNNNFVPLASGGARWQVPTSILQPRFFKIGAQFDW
jgi:hypothetical protein